jgi:hypothetical protein
MEPGRKVQGKRAAEGMRQLLGEGERLLVPVQGLFRIA